MRQRPDFTATCWTMVLQAGGDETQASEALEQLCGTYWYPLYVFARRQGLDAEAAQDAVQGFFERFLEKDYLGDVDRERGRFRSFLMASLKHYLSNEFKRAKRIKRGGEFTMVSFDVEEAEARFVAEPELVPPQLALDRSWATTTMDLALRALEKEYEASAKGPLLSALSEFLSREPQPGEYEQLAGKLGVSKGGVAVAVHRLRQRYGELIREQVAETVSHPTELEEEMRYLRDILVCSQQSLLRQGPKEV